MKQGIIPQKELTAINEVADMFKTFSANIKFCKTYEEVRKACKGCEISMNIIEEKYPEIKEILKSK